MKRLRKIGLRLAERPFVHRALRDEANDRLILQGRPSVRTWVGIGLLLFSYVIGWPAVGALGVLAFYLREPLILVIGGPLVYGLSHLVFLAGFYLAGAPYAMIFLRMGIRALYRKILSKPADPAAAPLGRAGGGHP